MSTTRPTLKQTAYGEFKEYLVISLYLWVVFGLLEVHRSIILSEHHINLALHGFALINALALAKVMFIARRLHLADQFNDAPLIYPTVVKAAVFSIVLAIFKILEDAALGHFHGKPLNQSIADLANGTWLGIIYLTALVAVLLIPFFGFTELARVFGAGKLEQFFFHPRHSLTPPTTTHNA